MHLHFHLLLVHFMCFWCICMHFFKHSHWNEWGLKCTFTQKRSTSTFFQVSHACCMLVWINDIGYNEIFHVMHWWVMNCKDVNGNLLTPSNMYQCILRYSGKQPDPVLHLKPTSGKTERVTPSDNDNTYQIALLIKFAIICPFLLTCLTYCITINSRLYL